MVAGRAIDVLVEIGAVSARGGSGIDPEVEIPAKRGASLRRFGLRSSLRPRNPPTVSSTTAGTEIFVQSGKALSLPAFGTSTVWAYLPKGATNSSLSRGRGGGRSLMHSFRSQYITVPYCGSGMLGGNSCWVSVRSSSIATSLQGARPAANGVHLHLGLMSRY